MRDLGLNEKAKRNAVAKKNGIEEWNRSGLCKCGKQDLKSRKGVLDSTLEKKGLANAIME